MDEPLTPLTEGAAGLHEMFASLVRAGFSETQALYMLGVFLAINAAPNSGHNPP